MSDIRDRAVQIYDTLPHEHPTAAPSASALKAAGKHFQAYFHDGVDHAFNNDTSAERYNKAAAKLAWGKDHRIPPHASR